MQRKVGGVFERFNNIEFFKNFTINEELGIITWQDELYVSPETLYSEATGAPLPSWVSTLIASGEQASAPDRKDQAAFAFKLS